MSGAPSRRWFERRGRTAVRVLALTAVGCCLAAAAYAATRPAVSGIPASGSEPLVPRIIEHPDSVTAADIADFDFAARGRPPRRAVVGKPLRFQCSLDEGSWEPCRSPLRLVGLRAGRHDFQVRAVNAAERYGPATAFGWRVRRAARAKPSEPPATPPVEPPAPPAAESPPFSIEEIGTLDALYPGAPAQPLALRLSNPNPVPITVTAVTVAIASDPPGCPSAENFDLTAAAITDDPPFAIAAESSATLPAPGIAAPTIAMRDLPVSQDACQGAELTLDFSGEAHE